MSEPQIAHEIQNFSAKQFTSTAFSDCLTQAGIQIHMDGRGRAQDNTFPDNGVYLGFNPLFKL